MKKVLLVVVMTLTLSAREFRTPLALYRHSMHEIECNRCDEWYVDLWTAYYQRKATEALGCSGNTVPLSCLLFNKLSFEVQEAFAHGMVSSPFDLLLSTRLTPCIEYSDKGAFLGLDIARNLCDWVRVGLRLKLPIRSFEFRNVRDPGFATGPQIDDFVVCRNRGQGQDCAYRLDFLSQLPVDLEEPGVRFNIVNYKNTQFPTMPITMSNQDVTDNPALNQEDRNPVTVLRQADGSVPPPPLSVPLGVAQSLLALPGDGSGVSDGGRARFVTGTDYTLLGTDQDTQEQFWVVNSIDDDEVVDPALILQNHVLQVLAC